MGWEAILKLLGSWFGQVLLVKDMISDVRCFTTLSRVAREPPAVIKRQKIANIVERGHAAVPRGFPDKVRLAMFESGCEAEATSYNRGEGAHQGLTTKPRPTKNGVLDPGAESPGGSLPAALSNNLYHVTQDGQDGGNQTLSISRHDPPLSQVALWVLVRPASLFT
jgi:hypothetical protein